MSHSIPLPIHPPRATGFTDPQRGVLFALHSGQSVNANTKWVGVRRNLATCFNRAEEDIKVNVKLQQVDNRLKCYN